MSTKNKIHFSLGLQTMLMVLAPALLVAFAGWYSLQESYRSMQLQQVAIETMEQEQKLVVDEVTMLVEHFVDLQINIADISLGLQTQLLAKERDLDKIGAMMVKEKASVKELLKHGVAFLQSLEASGYALSADAASQVAEALAEQDNPQQPLGYQVWRITNEINFRSMGLQSVYRKFTSSGVKTLDYLADNQLFKAKNNYSFDTSQRFITVRNGSQKLSQLFMQVSDLVSQQVTENKRLRQEQLRQELVDFEQQVYLYAGSGLVALLLLAALLVSLRITGPLRQIANAMSAASKGDLSVQAKGANRADEVGVIAGALGVFMGISRDNLAKQEQDRKLANENLRIKIALDSVKGNVMMADNDGVIIYSNASVMQMMKAAEADLRTALPDFEADKMLGANFDQFHANPEHQRNLLGSLTDIYETQFEIGGRSLQITANPVVNEMGERLGSVVEWRDLTGQVSAVKEIEKLIDQASAGELDARLQEDEFIGFLSTIATGINQVLDAVVVPIHEAQDVLQKMSEGDLQVSMDGDYQGEFARLQSSLTRTRDKLSETVAQIRSIGGDINTSSREISESNNSLSESTTEQASSLEETAASMEEMTATVRQNAHSAERADSLAKEASVVATKGGKVAQEAAEAMGEISASSKQIADIVNVIDNIAFQTNLLALNASVEAARAGEQGRGFSVVAQEVRKLAQRSAEAAKDIKTLIDDSVNRIDAGSRLAAESSDSLTKIVASVAEVSSIVTEIATASNEQSNGITQVNRAVEQMDSVTQRNAAQVEQTAAATTTMSRQAEDMMALMDFFKVDSASQWQPVASQSAVAPMTSQPVTATRASAP
ncbi:MAG TPA: hypothetical protein DE179_05295, partial [Oceanospirillaceae bacterium]|nr:hypothetical protein [Oceanospirillaceae bacterium]